MFAVSVRRESESQRVRDGRSGLAKGSCAARLRATGLAASALFVLGYHQQAHAQVITLPVGYPIPDMVVHPDPNETAPHSKGYVTDYWGNTLLGNANDPSHDEPLVWAIEHTGSGTNSQGETQHGQIIYLRSERWVPFAFDSTNLNGSQNVNELSSSPTTPVEIWAEPGATIASTMDTISMEVQGKFFGHPMNFVEWHGLKWEGAKGLAAIAIGNCFDVAVTTPVTQADPPITYKGWRFFDCEVDGLYDHLTQSGVQGKWGVSAWGLDGFEWIGGSVHDIFAEHAFYLRSSMGDITLSGIECWEVGRTFAQVTARHDEPATSCIGVALPQNPGNVSITGNTVIDIGLARGDGFHGGTAITVTGGQRGITTIAGNSIEFGFDSKTPGLKAASNFSRPRIFSRTSFTAVAGS